MTFNTGLNKLSQVAQVSARINVLFTIIVLKIALTMVCKLILKLILTLRRSAILQASAACLASHSVTPCFCVVLVSALSDCELRHPPGGSMTNVMK